MFSQSSSSPTPFFDTKTMESREVKTESETLAQLVEELIKLQGPQIQKNREHFRRIVTVTDIHKAPWATEKESKILEKILEIYDANEQLLNKILKTGTMTESEKSFLELYRDQFIKETDAEDPLYRKIIAKTTITPDIYKSLTSYMREQATVSQQQEAATASPTGMKQDIIENPEADIENPFGYPNPF